jgi:hypothetical protein
MLSPIMEEALQARLLKLTRADRVQALWRHSDFRMTSEVCVRIELHGEWHQLTLEFNDCLPANALVEQIVSHFEIWMIGYLMDSMGLTLERARREVMGRPVGIGGAPPTIDWKRLQWQ